METWNYKLPMLELNPDMQKDWNQTLLTIFNKLSIGIDNQVMIKVPMKLTPVIETLEFYDGTKNKIGDRFNVEFIESDSNIIYVGESELEVENFN